MKSELASSYSYNADHNVWSRASAAAFSYSDGDEVEQRIYRLVKNSADKSLFSNDLRKAITDWPSLYHLSSERANLLRPLTGKLDGPVLEIGCGCGAVTRFLGEKGLDVVALEGSARRAAIAAERCRDLPNVNVVVDPFQDFDIGRKFRTITLIGVLEYARIYFTKKNGHDPIDLMIQRAVDLLEPDGVLIIAIENQLGLKYFAGYAEDHLGQAMIGIEDRYTSRSVVTFGKADLSRRLRGAGLPAQEWWYPYPDYKLPSSVLSDAAFDADVPADFSDLIGAACRTDAQAPSATTFSLDFAWSTVVRNGLAGELANSFLIVSSRQEIIKDQVFGYHYGQARLPQYRKVVEFGRDDKGYYADRTPLTKNAPVADSTGAVLKLEREPLLPGRLWKDELRYVTVRDHWPMADVIYWSNFWWQQVRAKLGSSPINTQSPLPGHMLDAIPRNLIVDRDGNASFIDLEWTDPRPIEAGYLLFRGLLDAFNNLPFCGVAGSNTPSDVGGMILAASAGIGMPLSPADCERYLAVESALRTRIMGQPITMNPRSVLTKQIPQRALPQQMVVHQTKLLQAKDREIVSLKNAIEEMQQRVSVFTDSINVTLNEKDARIAQLEAQLASGRPVSHAIPAE